MEEYKEGYGRGPGATSWKVDEDGCVRRATWNDPSWAVFESRTPFKEMCGWEIELMLRNAYLAGMKDKAYEMRKILGVKE